MAARLSVARATVELAYSILSAEGFLEGRGAAGTYVNANLQIGLAPENVEASRVQASQNAGSAETNALPRVRPFQMGVPALDAFPKHLWARLAARHARDLSPRTMGLQSARGFFPLRRAIATYLRLARGVACWPEQVVITRGFRGALGLIARCLLEPGAEAWVEDPGYLYARLALATAGATIVPVPVDNEGLRVDVGLDVAPHARFAVVTPSHQAPLGVALSLSRRLSLLAWAKRNESWIIEDDYDSEFSYLGRPLPALKSLDDGGRVLYIGTFSKILFPSLQLGYIVAASGIAARLIEAQEALYPECSYLIQPVVADFIVQGHLARHIRRMKTLYAERRLALAKSLTKTLKDVEIELQAGGMHLIAHFTRSETDKQLALQALKHGLAVTPLSIHCVEATPGPALLLSFTNIPVQSAPREAARLWQALR